MLRRDELGVEDAERQRQEAGRRLRAVSGRRAHLYE